MQGIPIVLWATVLCSYVMCETSEEDEENNHGMPMLRMGKRESPEAIRMLRMGKREAPEAIRVLRMGRRAAPEAIQMLRMGKRDLENKFYKMKKSPPLPRLGLEAFKRYMENMDNSMQHTGYAPFPRLGYRQIEGEGQLDEAYIPLPRLGLEDRRALLPRLGSRSNQDQY